MDLYETTLKGNRNDDIAIYKPKQEEDEKFSRKKFEKYFRQIAKKFYPCDNLGFENNIYKIIALNEHQDEVRIKIDEHVKKFLTK